MTSLNGLQKRVNDLQTGQPVTLEVVDKKDQDGRSIATILLWNGRIVKTLPPGLWSAI